MAKASKWIKNILTGSKKQNSSKNHSAVITENPTTPIVITPATSKEKKRWSFRRSSATAPKNSNSIESTPTKPDVEPQKRPQLNVAEVSMKNDKAGSIQEAAATKIQSVFRSYLARKALRALRGLVKLQALVRGRLVRKRTTATLKCMEALITAQARARAKRIRSLEERKMYNNHRQSTYRVTGEDYKFRNSYHEVEKRMMEENIKIVEMDIGQSNTRHNKNSYYQNNARRDDRFSTHYASDSEYIPQDHNNKISPAPSGITDMSPRTCSGHFEDYSESDSMHLYPSYMANTQSSRAKSRSQSAPKQRPDAFERQPSRRRPSMEGRNIPRAVRMQRSSSNVGVSAQGYHYPWSIRLDKSSVSNIDSECGSTCSVVTKNNYCSSGAPYHYQAYRY